MGLDKWGAMASQSCWAGMSLCHPSHVQHLGSNPYLNYSSVSSLTAVLITQMWEVEI